MSRMLVLGVLAVALLAGCAPAAPRATPTPKVATDADAWFACTMFVERQYNISLRDAQRYTPAQISRVQDGAWVAEIAYAKHGAKFLCSIMKRADGNWQLVDLQLE